ncbi:uncharacterized protein LOC142975566 [Anticarsia gemmatalis]|uniref:uncharacterized protein LOC142975566 n=1 Tax=Anticarsia gemmatalis TaxID=129554 RepID=UPI003F7608DF
MTDSLKASFERCCRLCAEEQDVTIMIFSKEAEAMLLQNKLNKYLLIEVEEDDKLPKYICIQCCTKLQTVCEFIDKARKAQDLLLERSLTLDNVVTRDTGAISPIKFEPKSDDENHSDDENQMEVNVDPMMVLQNSEGPFPEDPSLNFDDSCAEDVTYLHGVDAENVTIKLIKKGEKVEAPTDSGDDDKNDSVIKPFPCLTCKRSFYTELALKNHTWQHMNDSVTAQFSCSECAEQFTSKADLIIHLKQHRSSGSCQLCGRMFRSEKNYIAHMAVHEPANQSYSCKICGRSYSTWGALKAHSITHSTERPYQCDFCKKTFKRNQDLKFHINQHTGAKPYKCPFCEKCFASSGNCYSHRNRMHPGKRLEGKGRRWKTTIKDSTSSQPNPTTPTLTAVKGIYKYQCQLCDHSFLKRDNFTYHMYQHTGEKPYQCLICPDKFVTRRGLIIHYEKEHPGKNRPLALISKNNLLK